jgi:LmbE family N-acetylglucosaminyl deacetylase
MLSGVNRLRILVISPHCDDAELAAGGSMSRLLNRGDEVIVIAIINRFKVNDKFIDLKEEFDKSMKALEVDQFMCFDAMSDEIHQKGYDLEQKFFNLKKQFEHTKRIDMVIAPSMNDLHEDHQRVSLASRRVFKFARKYLEYKHAWNKPIHKQIQNECNNFHIGFDEADMVNKEYALACYKTQEYREYFKPRYIRALATACGLHSKKTFAERFEVVRWHY